MRGSLNNTNVIRKIKNWNSKVLTMANKYIWEFQQLNLYTSICYL
jgi:hypothetical protein